MEFGRVMSHLRSPDTRTGKVVLFGTTLGSTALVASGCGGGSTTTIINRAPAAGNGNVPTKHDHLSRDERVHAQLTFDYLGGGSQTIDVYPGVASTSEDEVNNGEYNNGDTVGAICKLVGREIHSDPGVGEANRASDEWAKIAGPSPGEDYYASFVYTTDPHQLAMELPDC